MNYMKHYTTLVERGKHQQAMIHEKHHIVPTCMDGGNEPANITFLTPEEHFTAHVLLLRIYKDTPFRYALAKAVQMMCRGHKGKRARIMYGWLKREHRKAMSVCNTGCGNSQAGTIWIHQGCVCMKIKALDPIPPGWVRGRKSVKCTQEFFCQTCSVSIGKKRRKYCDEHGQQHKVALAKSRALDPTFSLRNLSPTKDKQRRQAISSTALHNAETKRKLLPQKSEWLTKKKPGPPASGRTLIEIERNGERKYVSPTAVPAYRKCGWVRCQSSLSCLPFVPDGKIELRSGVI